jgi:hypothetical protein
MLDIFDFPSPHQIISSGIKIDFSMQARDIKIVMTDTEKQVINWYVTKFETPFDVTALAFVASKGNHEHRVKLLQVLWPWGNFKGFKPDSNRTL